MKKFILLFLFVIFLVACSPISVPEELEISKDLIEGNDIRPANTDGDIVMTQFPSPTDTNTPIPSPSRTPTKRNTPTPVLPSETPSIEDVFQDFVTATPSESNLDLSSTLMMKFPECDMSFRYPVNWELELSYETQAGEGCVIDFRPNNWLEFIEGAELTYGGWSGEIRFLDVSNPKAFISPWKVRTYWFEDDRWHLSWNGRPPGTILDVVKIGDHFVIGKKIQIVHNNLETGAVDGERPYLYKLLANGEGQFVQIHAYPELIEDGIEVVLRTLEFNDAP